jgi:hypothetical protein
MQSKGKGAESAAKAGKANSKATSAKKKGSAGRPKAQGNGRLRPGQLDGLVLGYMKKHKGELPITATKVAQGIKRSSGAVGNCLGRLEKEKKVRLAGKKPRRYDLGGSTK